MNVLKRSQANKHISIARALTVRLLSISQTTTVTIMFIVIILNLNHDMDWYHLIE